MRSTKNRVGKLLLFQNRLWFSNHFQENEGKIFKLFECLSPRQGKGKSCNLPLITILSDSLNSVCLAASLFLSLGELEMEMRCESREEEPL